MRNTGDFVLPRSDPASVLAVRKWIEERLRTGASEKGWPEIAEAEEWCRDAITEAPRPVIVRPEKLLLQAVVPDPLRVVVPNDEGYTRLHIQNPVVNCTHAVASVRGNSYPLRYGDAQGQRWVRNDEELTAALASTMASEEVAKSIRYLLSLPRQPDDGEPCASDG